MQLGARTFGAMPATLALCALTFAAMFSSADLSAQELAERDFLDSADAVDSLVQPTRPTLPITPYESPLAKVYVTSDLVGFTRSNSGGIFATSSAGKPVLATNDLDFAVQPGLRTLLGVRLTDYTALEGSYVGLFNWNEQHSVQNFTVNTLGTAGNLFSPFTNFGKPAQAGFDYNNSVSVINETQLNSAEINLRYRIDVPYSTVQASTLIGTRYLSLKDRFLYQSQSAEPNPAGTANTMDVNTNNQMFGPQIGGALELHIAPRAWLNIETKGLMLYNDTNQSSQFTTGPLAGVGTTTTGGRSDHRLSFAADIQATLSWKFTRAIVYRIGYQALFVEGLSLGSENFSVNATNAFVDPSLLMKDGNCAFHGPFTGLTLTW